MNSFDYMRSWLLESWSLGNRDDADGLSYDEIMSKFFRGERPLELDRLSPGNVETGEFVGYYAGDGMKAGDAVPRLGTHPNKDWRRVEEFAEFIRSRDFPRKPSRIGGITAASTVEFAQRWGRQRIGLSDLPGRTIYRVAVKGKVVLVDATNLDVAWDNLPPDWKEFPMRDLARAVEAMRYYWNGNQSIRREDSFLPEVVIDGEAMVVEEV